MIQEKQLSVLIESLSIAYSFERLISNTFINRYETEKCGSKSVVTFDYSNKCRVDRVWDCKTKKKSFYAKHKIDDKYKNGLGDRSLWNPYHCDLFSLAQNNWILVHEGEKATDYALSKGLISSCIVGSGCKDEIIINNLIKKAKENKIQGFIYIADNDEQGIKKSKYIQKQCFKQDYPCLIIPIADLFKEAQEKDDIADWIIKYPNITGSIIVDEIESYINFCKDDLIKDYFSCNDLKRPTVKNGNQIPSNKDSIAQVREVLEQDYTSKLKYNELKRIVELDGEQAYLDDFYLVLHERYQIKIDKQKAYDLAVRFAKNNSYHPVKNYLDNLGEIDIPVDITKLSSLFFGTKDPIYDEMLYRTLIGSVARVYNNGCKLDTALVLQGDQGIGKSTFFKTLYGENFFTDDVHDTDKDNLMILHQYWCCELSELDYITSKKEAGKLKAFLSRSTDTFREPYGKSSMAYKRQSIFVGSCNKPEFLVDETGNRRFWVIPVQQEINIELVKLLKDSIWFQAMEAYQQGIQWHLPKELAKVNDELNAQYRIQDSWDNEGLDNYLHQFKDTGITIRDILFFHLQVEENQINRVHELRISKILTAKGWTKRQKRKNGKRYYLWLPSPSYEGVTLPNKTRVTPEPLAQQGVSHCHPLSPLFFRSFTDNGQNNTHFQVNMFDYKVLEKKGDKGDKGDNVDTASVPAVTLTKKKGDTRVTRVTLDEKMNQIAEQLNYNTEILNSLSHDFFSVDNWKDCSDNQKKELIIHLEYKLRLVKNGVKQGSKNKD